MQCSAEYNIIVSTYEYVVFVDDDCSLLARRKAKDNSLLADPWQLECEARLFSHHAFDVERKSSSRVEFSSLAIHCPKDKHT